MRVRVHDRLLAEHSTILSISCELTEVSHLVLDLRLDAVEVLRQFRCRQSLFFTIVIKEARLIFILWHYRVVVLLTAWDNFILVMLLLMPATLWPERWLLQGVMHGSTMLISSSPFLPDARGWFHILQRLLL